MICDECIGAIYLRGTSGLSLQLLQIDLRDGNLFDSQQTVFDHLEFFPIELALI